MQHPSFYGFTFYSSFVGNWLYSFFSFFFFAFYGSFPRRGTKNVFLDRHFTIVEPQKFNYPKLTTEWQAPVEFHSLPQFFFFGISCVAQLSVHRMIYKVWCIAAIHIYFQWAQSNTRDSLRATHKHTLTMRWRRISLLHFCLSFLHLFIFILFIFSYVIFFFFIFSFVFLLFMLCGGVCLKCKYLPMRQFCSTRICEVRLLLIESTSLYNKNICI